MLGLDQGDFNGDGILDIAALTYRLETWYNNAATARHTVEIVVVLGDGNGGFSTPSVVYQYVQLGNFYQRHFKYLRAEDINRDSHLDLVATDEATGSLIVALGLGQGTFHPATTTSMSVSLNDYRLVDLDQDGKQDIVGRSGDWSRFGWMKGNGDGTFTSFVDITTGGGVSNQGSELGIRPYQFVDLNKDGHLDIVLSKYGEGSTVVLLNDGNQNFSIVTTFPGARALFLYVADFTGDGNYDVLYARSHQGFVEMQVGDESGIRYSYRATNTMVASWPGNRAGADQPVDIDGDGDLDVVFTNGQSGAQGFDVTHVLLNDGLGDFTMTGYTLQRNDDNYSDLQPLAVLNVSGVVVGDYNRDGRLDFATLANSGDFNGVSIALGTRPGEFLANPNITIVGTTSTFNTRVHAADFNGDGFQDLLAMPTRSMRLGNGDGTFRDPFPAVSISSSDKLLIEDFNQDGIPDILFNRTYEYVAAMGNGDGTFAITYRGGHGNFYDASTLQSADFNNDGYMDFIAKFGTEKVLDIYLYEPLSPGTFVASQRINLQATGIDARGWGGAVTVGDFDGNGRADLIVADARPGEWKRLITYSGQGDGTFEVTQEQADYADGANPNFLKSGDLDEDGFLDVVTFSSSTVVVHMGKGDGTFHKPLLLPESGCGGSSSCVSDNDWGHLADVNRDGHLDLVYNTSRNISISIRLGHGDGSFSPPQSWHSHAGPSAPVFADFDNDGHFDIAHATNGSIASIYFGARDGLVDLVSTDINGDGNTDVLAVNAANDRLKLFVGNNLGELRRIPDLQTGRAPSAVAVADLDRNQSLEFITANRSGRSISVFSGSLTTQYVAIEYPVGKSPIDVATGDFNRDQNPDVFVLDAENAVWLMAGSVDGLLATPVAIAIGDKPGKFTAQDATGDGLIDLVITLPESNRLLILPGNGTSFGNPQYLSQDSSPADVAVMDLNGDGRPDLVSSLPDRDQLSILYSRGGGQYSSAQLVNVGDQPSALTVSDLDDDGKLDIFVTNRGDDTVSILYNRFDPNEIYRYDADALDPDGDALTYRVVEGPGGLFINAESGQVFWAASPDEIGQHRVVLEASDNRGGLATQSFQIDVQASQENASPLIATTPTTTIGAGQSFRYQASAFDGDRETLRYRLLQGPDGAKIDPITGLVEWNGSSDRAIQLNPYASSGYVEVPSSPTLKPANVTVEGWYKFNSTTLAGGSQILFEMDGTGNPAAYLLYTTTAGKLVLDLNQATSAELVRLEGNFVPTLGQWYHFAFSFDDDTGLLNIFVDGELLASRSTEKSILYGPGSLFLGTTGGALSHVTIDKFRVWNTARTPAQIVEGLGRNYDNEASLVLNLRFEDQNTVSVLDHSPAVNHGTRAGGLPPLLVDGLADSGVHSFVISVEDGRGGFDTQSFQLDIVPELRGSIAGQLFEDANRDGVKGVGELALSGWVLYLDHNGNAYPDPSEPSATTDATGKYRFSSLLPGSYPVRVVSVAGYSPAGPASASVTANRTSTLDRAIESLALGQIRGLLKTETNQPIANWKVFADLDLDALLDENEPVATTDSQGSYAIAGLSAGEYTIRTSLPAGWSNLAGNVGLPVSLGPSLISAGNDFTLRPTNTSVTGGVHFVTTPSTTAEARQVYRYAALATNLNKTTIAYDLSLAPSGMVIDPVSGLIAWRPTIEQVGEHSVVVRATDVSGSIALHDFLIVVNSPNTAPVFVTNPPVVAYVGTPYVHDFAAQDAEASLLTFSIVSGPTGATIDPASGRFRWTPTASDVGPVSLTIEVKDASNSPMRRTVAIDVISNAPDALPLLTQLPRTSEAIGQEYLSQIRASDGLKRPATWSLVDGPSGLAISSVGLLRWTPISSDLGTKTVRLLATTADGATQEVEFTIEVQGWLTNSEPEITSTPNLSAVAGREYRYQVQVADKDRDSLSFSLLSAPSGMSIHPELGIIAWTSALDQLGSATVNVQVTDTTGATANQSFSLRVGRTGGPPMITSVPGSEAYVGQGYLYTILTNDSEGDTMLYRLLAAPAGMQIAATTGEISWTPSLDQMGQQIVAIEVSDGTGGATTQSFAIRVRDGAHNEPPKIASRSPRFGAVGTQYTYTLQALDPESTTITYSLGRGPAGMIVDASTGLVQWTPTLGQVGKSIVTLLATDAGGANAFESFEFDVLAENRRPTITSTSPLEVPARAEFRYDVLARDLDLDLLQYRLLTAPAGATVDAFGSIRWLTRPDLIGPHDFQVLVSDPRGGEAMQSFRLNVIADIVPPKVSLIHGPGKARVFPWQGPLTLYAKAIDNVEVDSLTVTVNGQEIQLNASGQSTFSFEEWGFTRLNTIAKAIDTNGNVTEKSVSFGFAFPEGWGDSGVAIPTVAISGPAETATVFGMVTITGTASHPDFAGYKLSYRRVDETDFTQFFESTTAVVNGTLGVWDTSLLINDEYVLRLEAASSTGVVNVVEQNVGLSGELKLGNFRLSFTDMVIPVAGIPIQITRIYDTLQSDRQGDFGYGWRLEYRDTDLRVGVPKSGLEDIGIYSPLRQGVKVYLNVPGVGRQGFTFNPEIRVLPGFGGNNLVLARPRFTPDRGVTSTLSTGTSNYLQVNELGELFAPGGIPYNPASPDFGGAYVLTTKEGIRYRINGANGKLLSATDRNGHSVTFSIDGIKSDTGVGIDFQKDARGRIVQMNAPDGSNHRYLYDARGNLSQHIDGDNNRTRFVYESIGSSHRLVEVLDPLGRMGARSEYDADGRLTSFAGADGRRIDLQFDPGTLQEVIVDASGNTTIIQSDQKGNVVQTVDSLGGITRNVYDANNNQISSTNAANETTKRTFDLNGNMIASTDPLGFSSTLAYNELNLVTSIVDPLGRATTFEYDTVGRLTRTTQSNGESESNEYDASGRLISSTDALGNARRFELNSSDYVIGEIDRRGRRTTKTYDAVGNVLSITDPIGNTTRITVDRNRNVTSTTDSLGHTTRLTYDPLGMLVSQTDALGNVVQFEVDGVGNILRETDPLGHSKLKEYDQQNNLVATTDENGQTVRYFYDALSRRVRTLDPSGAESKIVYDAVGRVVRQENAKGFVTAFEYDAAGRNIATTDAMGNRQRFHYDAVGNLVKAIDPSGNITTFEYDSMNRLLRTLHPDGSVRENSYDALGNLIQTKDPLGNSSQFIYDENGSLIQVFDALGASTRFEYNANNQQIRQVDALGRQTQFEYDANGNQIAKIFPDGSRESQTYDSAGRLTGFVDASGSRTQWTMNGEGRVLAKQFADGSSESFTYTPTGLLRSATNSSGTVRYEYDSADRLVRVESPTGASIEYGYDKLGNRVRVTSKVGTEAPKTTLYEYDALNRLASVTEPDGQKTQYNYDANGNLIKTTLPNGVTTEYSIDAMNRIVGLVLRQDGNIFQTHQYQYDLNGDRVKSVQDGVSLVEYAYDAGRRLISEIGRDQTGSTVYSLTYNYDVVGNRVAMVDDSGATTHYSYNVNDQLVSYGSTVLAYDARGNLVSRTKDTTATVYTYDYENQLIEVDGPSGTIEYRSDATGERLSRTEGGNTTHFLVDLNNPTGVSQVAVEYNQQGATQASYAYGLQLIGQEVNGIHRYHHHDANGNVRLLTDSQGQVTDSYSYTAFGVMLETTGTTENHYQFAGERYQEAESLSFFRARSYDAEMGRFISRDPYQGRLAEPVTLHRYLYANSNPISFRDPTGLFSIPELATASSLMGSIQTNYASALTSVFKSSVEIANDYILVGTKGRELVLNALFVGVWTPGIMNVLIDSNDTISNGFKLISKTANNELIKFGFSLFSPISTVEHTVSKGKFKGLTFQFDLSGPAGDLATSENGEAFITSGGLLNGLVPSFPQLGPLGNLAKATSSITQKAVLGESVGRESVSQAQGLIKDLINAFRDR